jgi:hypothetical protein
MLGPGNGTRRRHDQAAEPGLLVLHTPWGTGDDQRTRQPQQPGRREHQALKGLDNHYPGVTDRAVKASPTAGLRPALTALPTQHNAKGLISRASTSTRTHASPPNAKAN